MAAVEAEGQVIERLGSVGFKKSVANRRGRQLAGAA
jgi:hypothetical protein